MSEDGFRLRDAKVAIVGLGLMGGSLALALKGGCAALLGIDPDPAALSLALRQNIVDQAESDPAKLLPQADLVILAAPVPVILSLLEKLPEYTSSPCIVLDLGSTKRAIVEQMDSLPERFDPLGGHPICGKEKLTLANAERTLYYGAPFILTPLARTTPRALSVAQQVIATIGAKAVTLDAAEHDRILAATSHLPFLLSSALALATPEECAPLVGPGFRSTSRLAGTPSSMMMGVMQTNRENILAAIHRLQAQLDTLEMQLAASDFANLEATLNQAQSQHRLFTP
ncbi:MAG: prephenate dehydrogenase [Chloroflexota bacterium]